MFKLKPYPLLLLSFYAPPKRDHHHHHHHLPLYHCKLKTSLPSSYTLCRRPEVSVNIYYHSPSSRPSANDRKPTCFSPIDILIEDNTKSDSDEKQKETAHDGHGLLLSCHRPPVEGELASILACPEGIFYTAQSVWVDCLRNRFGSTTQLRAYLSLQQGLFDKEKNPANPHSVSPRSAYFGLTSSSSSLNSDDTAKPSLSVSADSSSAPKARFVARRTESVSVRPLERPLLEYMSLPASQYSVLDAQRIERIDDKTFRCYVYKFKFFAFEVCPVLLVRVEEQPNGCSINLLSCKLEGSPIVVAQNNKFEGVH
ncbi:unnamed protein product [Lactuca virosa]|uniref:Uncharacterized protein n=1 Tax=Lactuca virosa TaxID=75947 RepID=A0AAU9NJQ5_9ASTR|nr:unnamed protein product [Lactuca virosa]